jgi:hypothetical protein
MLPMLVMNFLEQKKWLHNLKQSLTWLQMKIFVEAPPSILKALATTPNIALKGLMVQWNAINFVIFDGSILIRPQF